MKKITTNRERVIESVTKMVSDKNVVQSFLRGQTSIETLKQKGIKLANPL